MQRSEGEADGVPAPPAGVADRATCPGVVQGRLRADAATGGSTHGGGLVTWVSEIGHPRSDTVSRGRADESPVGHELLQTLPRIHFSRVDVGVRIDRNLMEPVELAGVASTAAERAELLT